MRLGIVALPRARSGGEDAAPLGRLAGLARAVEAAGFAGIWVTDSFGRGVARLDPLVTLGAMAAVTDRIELGTCILQISPRNPAELAHRVASVSVLSGGRLRLGVGPGSSRGDFDVTGADYAGRFRAFEPAIALMRRAWAGETVNAGRLTPWPGAVSAPPLLLAAWRNPAWVARAGASYDGWIASGLHSEWEQLEAGMRAFREAGGRRAVLANVPVDLVDDPAASPLASRGTISLVGPPALARERLHRLREIGFDDVLLLAPDDPAELVRLRELI